MRARWLKPEFFRDKKIAALGPVAALVYQALWVSADDGGVAPADPEDIKSAMFSRWTAVGLPEVTEALRHLYYASRVVFYQDGDDLFAFLPKFDEHQKVHNPSAFRNLPHMKDLPTVLPEWCRSTAAVVRQDSPPRHLDTQIPRHLDTQTPKVAAAPPNRATWLTPYIEAWDRVGGSPSAGALAKAVKPVEQEIGSERALAALEAYLAAGKASFGPQVFARAWRDWDATAQNGHRSPSERVAADALTAPLEEFR